MGEARAGDNVEDLRARERTKDGLASHRVDAEDGDEHVHRAGEEDALDGADALIIVTEWNEFRGPDFDRMKTLLKQPVIFDGRNVYEPQTMREKGFTYYSIGRRPVKPGAESA